MSKSMVEKILGYKRDKTNTYKNMTSYYDEYQPYLRENKLYSDLSYDEFKENLKKRAGQSERFQAFVDLLFTEGYNLGMAQREVGLSFDEVSIAMDGLRRKCDFFGREYRE